MKILVTGATGYLGSRLVKFLERRHEILAPTSLQLDICDQYGVSGYMRDNQPEAVIHCAAVSDVGRCEKEPKKSYRINVEGACYLADSAKEIGAKCILCSSDQVYAGSSYQQPHSETESLEPCHVYGRQKLEMEQRCMELNPDSVLLRLTWLYDTEWENTKEHGDFIKTFFENKKKQNELEFPIYEYRGLTNVNEVIANIESAMHLPGGVYNFGSQNGWNFYETMLKTAEKLVNEKWKIKKNEELFFGAPRNICMNTKKIEACGIRFQNTVEALAAAISARNVPET